MISKKSAARALLETAPPIGATATQNVHTKVKRVVIKRYNGNTGHSQLL